jgi:hypothetical protein
MASGWPSATSSSSVIESPSWSSTSSKASKTASRASRVSSDGNRGRRYPIDSKS